MANDTLQGTGFFVPTTNIWDVQQIQSANVNSAEFKELLIRLYQNINKISLALNAKDIGYYPSFETVNGQLFFPASATNVYRQVFRNTISIGALPNATTLSVPHNIAISSTPPLTNISFTRIYGTANKSDQTSFIPLPFASSTLNQNITVIVDNTNINITTAIDYSAYDVCYIVLEYIKS